MAPTKLESMCTQALAVPRGPSGYGRGARPMKSNEKNPKYASRNPKSSRENRPVSRWWFSLWFCFRGNIRAERAEHPREGTDLGKIIFINKNRSLLPSNTPMTCVQCWSNPTRE